MKKQMRYKKSREKNFKKNTSFDSSHQNISRYDNNLSDNNSMVDIQENSTLKSNGISSKKMQKNFYSQEDNSMKESMNLSKDKLVSKNQSKHFMSGQYEKNIRNDELYPLSDNGEKNQTFSRKENQKKKMRKQIDKFKQEKEVYDPLSKDMDNDGVIDRYDMDFRDSKVSYRQLSEEEKGESSQNNYPNNQDIKNLKSKNKRYKNYAKESFFKESSKSENQKKYVKSNFEDQKFTRDKDTKKKSFQDVKNEGKTSDKSTSQKKTGKFENKEKKISKLQQKKQRQEQKLKNKGIDGKTQSAKSVVMATGVVKSYLESGKEDNAGVEGTHKAVEKLENISRHAYNRGKKKVLKRKKKISKLDKSIQKQEKKLFFQKNMEEFKKSSEYQNTSRLKQFFKRRQYKRQIQKKYKDSVKNKIKKSFIESSKRFAEFVKSRGKKIGFLLLIVIGIFFMLFQAGTMLMNMGTGMVGNTISTTYLSSEDRLKEINQEFSSLEQELQEEMDSVYENHPGYDEYIINGKENIGHSVHELLSYITARFGVVKEVSEVESELQSLFHQMYTLTYKEEIEIRYRTVTSEDGESHEEAYEYKKLIVTLEKREMDTIIREVFRSYPDNLSHYETLLASKGNMELAFGSGNGDLSEIINNPDFSNPGLEFNGESVKAIVHEAEKHIGKRYVFGANGPSNFDCSSFVCWTYTHSGIKNMPRTTAWRIYTDYCNPVSPSEAKAGDIIFFKGTYNSGSPISHVGIYVGGGYMIHAGDPIQYARIDTPYWKQHFYGFGRPK